MNTYYDIFGVCSPAEAKAIIEAEVKKYGVDNPRNLEEQAINMDDTILEAMKDAEKLKYIT